MSKESDTSRLQLFLGILGFVGVLLGILATIFAPIIQENIKQRTAPTQTPIIIIASPSQMPVIPTDTLLPDEPTFTSVPPIDSPAPTFTPVPPVEIGVDLTQGCISTLWKVYPVDAPVEDKGNGCWQEPVGIFTADQGKLFMATTRSERGPVDVHGLFALMPESGEVTFTVRLKKANSIDFFTGIFTELDATRGDFVLSIPGDGNVSKLRIVQKDNIVSNNTITGTALLDQGSGYSITFTFSESNTSAKVNPFVFVFDPIPLPSAQKWLFLGYKNGAGAYEADIEVSNLTIK